MAFRKICVISACHSHSEHPIMDADVYRKDPRILSASAVSLLYDSNLISLIGSTPEVTEWDDRMPKDLLTSADLIVVPHAVTDDIEELLIPLAQNGRKLFWVRPSASALEKASSGKLHLLRTFHSHCERWNLPGGSFIWPQPIDYDAYDANPAQGDWLIGNDWPSVVRAGNTTFCPGGVFHAFNWYWNSPLDTIKDDGLFNAFHCMFVGEIVKLLGFDWNATSAKKNFFIRRDFHAYGFARLMVSDLYRIKEKLPEFSNADKLLYNAAKLVGVAPEAEVENALKPAFEELYKIRCNLIDIPVYYAEALHGGILTDEFGYIEIASPEFVKEQMETLMYFARRRKGHFNVDISIISLFYLDRRHPSFTKLFKEGIEDGIFEVCNGTTGQPYPHLFSLESNIRQIETGQNILMQLYGRKADTLVAQEMQLVPSYPTLLSQGGYTLAIHRIQNKGATVYGDVVSMNWRAPDGSEIVTVPTHYDDSQRVTALIHLHWPKLLAKTAETYEMGVYTNLLDNTWNTAFREESNRACYYAPVFGEFVTYRELAQKLPSPAISREYSRRDYLPEMQPGTSTLLREMRSMSDKLEALEKYMALSGSENANEALNNAWIDLCAHQNHDNTVCFFVAPRLRYMWPEAHGPVRTAPNLYDVTRDKTLASIKICEDITGQGDALFNPLDRDRTMTLVRLGKDIHVGQYGSGSTAGKIINLKRIHALDSIEAAARLKIPAHGIINSIDFKQLSVGESTGTVLDNGQLRIELDEGTGALKSARDLSTGKELSNGSNARLSVGVDGNAKLLSSRVLSAGAIKQFALRIELTNGEGDFAGWADQYITLPDFGKRVYFTTTYYPYNKPARPYRPYSHARKTGLYAGFSLNKDYNAISDCWLHQIDKAPDETCVNFSVGGVAAPFTKRYLPDSPDCAYTQSAMGLILRSGSDFAILHNDGAQIYDIKGLAVSQLLWGECDYDSTISYAIEWADDNPFAVMLDYQYDLLGVPDASLAHAPSIDNPGIWISSIRLIGGYLYVRLAEIEGRSNSARLSIDGGIKSAEYVDLLGESQMPAVVEADGGINVFFEKNGVKTLKIKV